MAYIKYIIKITEALVSKKKKIHDFGRCQEKLLGMGIYDYDTSYAFLIKIHMKF